MTSVSIDQLDWHLGEAESLLEIVIFIAELEAEERARLCPAAITVLHIMGDRLRAADRALAILRQSPP